MYYFIKATFFRLRSKVVSFPPKGVVFNLLDCTGHSFLWCAFGRLAPSGSLGGEDLWAGGTASQGGGSLGCSWMWMLPFPWMVLFLLRMVCFLLLMVCFLLLMAFPAGRGSLGREDGFAVTPLVLTPFVPFRFMRRIINKYATNIIIVLL